MKHYVVMGIVVGALSTTEFRTADQILSNILRYGAATDVSIYQIKGALVVMKEQGTVIEEKLERRWYQGIIDYFVKPESRWKLAK